MSSRLGRRLPQPPIILRGVIELSADTTAAVTGTATAAAAVTATAATPAGTTRAAVVVSAQPQRQRLSSDGFLLVAPPLQIDTSTTGALSGQVTAAASITAASLDPNRPATVIVAGDRTAGRRARATREPALIVTAQVVEGTTPSVDLTGQAVASAAITAVATIPAIRRPIVVQDLTGPVRARTRPDSTFMAMAPPMQVAGPTGDVAAQALATAAVTATADLPAPAALTGVATAAASITAVTGAAVVVVATAEAAITATATNPAIYRAPVIVQPSATARQAWGRPAVNVLAVAPPVHLDAVTPIVSAAATASASISASATGPAVELTGAVTAVALITATADYTAPVPPHPAVVVVSHARAAYIRRRTETTVFTGPLLDEQASTTGTVTGQATAAATVTAAASQPTTGAPVATATATALVSASATGGASTALLARTATVSALVTATTATVSRRGYVVGIPRGDRTWP